MGFAQGGSVTSEHCGVTGVIYWELKMGNDTGRRKVLGGSGRGFLGEVNLGGLARDAG